MVENSYNKIGGHSNDGMDWCEHITYVTGGSTATYVVASATDGTGSLSFWCHQNRKCHLDEFLITIDCNQGGAYIVGNFGRTALLNPKRKLQDCGFQGELVFVELEK